MTASTNPTPSPRSGEVASDSAYVLHLRERLSHEDDAEMDWPMSVGEVKTLLTQLAAANERVVQLRVGLTIAISMVKFGEQWHDEGQCKNCDTLRALIASQGVGNE